MFAPATDDPEGEKAEAGAKSVDENVTYFGGARGDKGLVKLVGGCVKGGNAQGESGDAPGPWRRGGSERIIRGDASPYFSMAATRLVEGAPEDEGKDGIFGDVSRLACVMNDSVEGFLGNVRGEEADDWRDDTGAVLAGRFISGGAKDERAPNQDGEPVFEE